MKKLVSGPATEVVGKGAEVKKLDNIRHFYTHPFLKLHCPSVLQYC